MIATVIFVAALFTSSSATVPSGSQSYGGYNQHQHEQLQKQQYNPLHQHQQDRWYAESNEASYIAQTSALTPDSKTPPQDVEATTLPEGWSEHFDPNSGQYYYYNAADGITSWERPMIPDIADQGVGEGENKGGDSLSSEQKPDSAGATDVAKNPEQELQEISEDLVEGRINGVSGKDSLSTSSREVESWQSNQNPQIKQPTPAQPSVIQRQQTSWGGQRQSGHPQVNDWVSTQPIQQQYGETKWGQSNSTESSVVGGEQEVQKGEYQGQPPQTQPQEQGQSSGWGMTQQMETDDSSQKLVEPWGVSKSPEQRHQYHTDGRKQLPPPVPSKDTQASSSDSSSDNASNNRGWGMPKPAETFQSGNIPQNTDASYNQRQSWQSQRLTTGDQKSLLPQQRPPVQQGPRHDNMIPPQQQPARPYVQRQYPPQPYGSYNSNAQPGQGHYDPKYGGQNSYGRGYPPQQPSHPQPNNSGQLISQGTEDGSSAVKDALTTTWKGLLGFGDRTREVVGTARNQVVTGATAAGQTLSAKSSTIWETAKSTVGGVFENNESGSQPGYSLSGTQPSPDNRPPQSYQGRPTGLNQGYPHVSGGPGGRGPPPRSFGGQLQQPGRYGPPIGQQPRYGAPSQSGSVETPGRQQPPAPNQLSQHQMKPSGYPNMQPRRDHPYPQTPKGQERIPIQSQYGNQSRSQQPAQGGYSMQQRPPFSGPSEPQPNKGPAYQGTPQQENQSDAWDHPALTGEF